MRRDREHKLDLADIGGETDAATHGSNLSLARQTTQETGHDRTGMRTFNLEQNRNYHHARQPARDRHDGRAALSRADKYRCATGGFGQRYADMTEWLDGNCGADGWAITPSGMRGVLNDAVSIYFRDATLASAFVARWCAASRVETEGGLFRIRESRRQG
jgi:hypothetical protein